MCNIFKFRDNRIHPQSNLPPSSNSSSQSQSSVGRSFSANRLTTGDHETVVGSLAKKAKTMMPKMTNWCLNTPHLPTRQVEPLNAGGTRNAQTSGTDRSLLQKCKEKVEKVVKKIKALFSNSAEITPLDISVNRINPNTTQQQAQTSHLAQADLTLSIAPPSSVRNIQEPTQTDKSEILDMVQRSAELCRKLVNLKIEYNEIDDSTSEGERRIEEIGKQIDSRESEIEKIDDEILQKINQKYFGIGNKDNYIIKNVPVDFCKFDKSGSINLMSQIKYNNLINQAEYLRGVLMYFKNDLNKGNMVKEFDTKQQFSRADINEIQVNIRIIEGAETHNRGKSPLFITFEHGDKRLQIVYKPRDASTDQEMIQLFQSLNTRSPMAPPLPTYKILQTEQGSIWEYIEGEHPTSEYVAASNSLSQSARQNLERLEAVCKSVGATDLHGENIIINNDRIVPIDLEVVLTDSEQPTGLYGAAKSTQPNRQFQNSVLDNERPLIDGFIDRQKGRVSRFVPVPTKTLVNLMSDGESAQAVAEEFYATFVEAFTDVFAYDIVLDANDFKACIENDVINGDVPYFTKKGDCVYYGVYKEGQRNIMVAQKNH